MPQCTAASGPLVTKTIPLESFTKIEASGQIKLYLKQDSHESVAIEAQESIADLVSAEVQNGALIIGLGNLPATGGPCIDEAQTKTRVFVSATGIESIKASDSAKVFTEGRIYPESNLFLSASNSALIDANVSVGDLNSFASSSGTTILQGLAERHSAKAITGGRIIADKLETMQGFFDAEDNGSIGATVFGDVSTVAKTGGSIGFGGGANIINSATESGGTITEIPDSGSDDGGEVPEDDGSGGGDLPDEGAPPGDGDEEPPPDDGGEEPTEPICGNAELEAYEECEANGDCAIGEECIDCQCLESPVSTPEFMTFEACIALGGNVECAEIPPCPLGVKNAGNVESDGLPCICCVSA